MKKYAWTIICAPLAILLFVVIISSSTNWPGIGILGVCISEGLCCILLDLIFSILLRTSKCQAFLYFMIPMTKVWGKVMAARNEKKRGIK